MYRHHRGSSLHEIDPDDPNAAFDELLENARRLLEPRRGAGVLNTDATLWVFEEFRKSAALSALHAQAIVPVPARASRPRADANLSTRASRGS